MQTLLVPDFLVPLVDRALQREGLAVTEQPAITSAAAWYEVALGAPLPDVPRLLAHDGPTLRERIDAAQAVGRPWRDARAVRGGCGVG